MRISYTMQRNRVSIIIIIDVHVMDIDHTHEIITHQLNRLSLLSISAPLHDHSADINILKQLMGDISDLPNYSHYTNFDAKKPSLNDQV